MIPVGIIPDMDKEPKTNTFLRPLVDELLVAWKHGYLTKTLQSPKQAVQFKIAVINSLDVTFHLHETRVVYWDTHQIWAVRSVFRNSPAKLVPKTIRVSM